MLPTFNNRYENYNSSLPCFKPMCVKVVQID